MQLYRWRRHGSPRRCLIHPNGALDGSFSQKRTANSHPERLFTPRLNSSARECNAPFRTNNSRCNAAHSRLLYFRNYHEITSKIGRFLPRLASYCSRFSKGAPRNFKSTTRAMKLSRMRRTHSDAVSLVH